MALVKGLREGGVINVSKDMVFSGNVAMRAGADFVPKRTDIYYVDGTDGNDENSGKTPHRALATPEAAFLKAGNDDRVYIAGQGDWMRLAAAVDWSYNDGRIIGNAITPMQPRLDIGMAYTSTFNPMFTVSGKGNVLANLTFRHGSETEANSNTGYATDLICMKVSGRYNYFENVYFYTPMYSQQNVANTDVGDNDGYCGVEVSGHNNYFRGCKFGGDSLARSGLNFNLLLNGGVGNMFEDCFFQMTASANTPSFVGVNSVPRDMKVTLFKNCTFYAHSGNYATAVADAFKYRLAGSSPTGNTAGIILQGCNFVNVEEVSDTASDLWIWREVPATTSTVTNADIALRSQGA